MPKLVIESMTRRQVIGFTVRAWVNCEPEGLTIEHAAEKAFGPDRNVLTAMNEAIQTHGKTITRAQIVSFLKTVPNIAAYEIVDGAGMGVVIYPDWA